VDQVFDTYLLIFCVFGIQLSSFIFISQNVMYIVIFAYFVLDSPSANNLIEYLWFLVDNRNIMAWKLSCFLVLILEFVSVRCN